VTLSSLWVQVLEAVPGSDDAGLSFLGPPLPDATARAVATGAQPSPGLSCDQPLGVAPHLRWCDVKVWQARLFTHAMSTGELNPITLQPYAPLPALPSRVLRPLPLNCSAPGSLQSARRRGKDRDPGEPLGFPFCLSTSERLAVV
jgi:hypothetical protein